MTEVVGGEGGRINARVCCPCRMTMQERRAHALGIRMNFQATAQNCRSGDLKE